SRACLMRSATSRRLSLSRYSSSSLSFSSPSGVINVSRANSPRFLLLVGFVRRKSPAMWRKMSPHRRDRNHEGPGEARQYSAAVSGGREARSGVHGGLQSRLHAGGVLDLRVVPDLLEACDRRPGTQLEHRVQNFLGGHG